MGFKANVGDVFLVPLAGNTSALGQVIDDYKGELYISIFDHKFQGSEIDPHEVVNIQPVFLTLTLDAKIFHGSWPVIGNVQENLVDFPQPAFKVDQSGVMYIESRDRSVTRPATSSETKLLQNRRVSSPALIEEATQAHFGIGAWNSHFDRYYADHAHASALLLKNLS